MENKQHTPHNGKLIMMKGLPRSGKSTWVKNFIAESGNAIAVSRDELRKMLHYNKWTPRNEKKTMSAQMAIVKDALANGTTVLIDDTNLTQHHLDRWTNVAKEMNSNFEVRHIKEKDVRTLVQRDMVAAEQRGADVIVKMALESKALTFAHDSVVLCDLDGTLCDIEHRRVHVRDGKKDWKSFFDEMGGDKIFTQTLEQLKDMVTNGKTIIFVSARPEKYREVTEKWLAQHGIILDYKMPAIVTYSSQLPVITYAGLLMRPDGDSRDDVIVKQEILDKYLLKEWVHKVFDDRPKVIRMWRANGFDVVDCGDGVEF